MIDEKLLKNDERAIVALRALYRQYGYRPFKMGKFEEYDLYVRNKDFLVSDRIITFNDTNGKLLALKPDVTLSIIKNGEDIPGVKQKVYYNENVYRVSGATHQYKEIMQTGLECIGDIDGYDIFECVSLAAASLGLISPDYVLDVSHLGVLSALLDECSDDKAFRREATACIAAKNPHDLMRVCADYGVDADKAANLCAFVGIYGDMPSVIERLVPLCTGETAKAALGDLRALCDLLADTPYAAHIRLDFSIVNDMRYYNGIVFKGFLAGICEGVLSGGQYDNLMRKMGRRAGAIGFALYLDLLEDLQTETREYDVDVLVLYDAATSPKALADKVEALTAAGRSVTAQRAVPPSLRAREVCDLREEN